MLNRPVVTVALLALAACKPLPVPDEPDVVIVSSIDASTLRDAGPDASPCALFCAHLAAPEPPCREAIAPCIPACERAMVRGLLSLDDVACVSHANGRAEIQTCGRFCP